MCRVYGYHRTSTKEQHLDRGIKAIKEYCEKNGIELEHIFTDQQTGKNFDRPSYKTLKELVSNKNDCTIIISEIDRLGRNKEDTLKELRYFKENNVRIMILEIPTTLTDYSKLNDDMAKMMMETINNMLIEMYTNFAQAEMMKREKRQSEGIQAMKDRGEWESYGRPKVKIDNKFEEAYKEWKAGNIKAIEAMEKAGMTKATFYRKVKEYETEKAV